MGLEKYNIKTIRKLPKTWNSSAISEKVFGDIEFSIYCDKLFNSLIGIKKYYENDFNINNSYTIDEYINIFNSIYNNFLELAINDKNITTEYFEYCKNNKIDINSKARFDIFDKIQYRNKDVFRINKNNETIGFTKYGYDKVKEIANQLFIIEKLCAFTTRKFWKKELTDANKINLKSNFKILVKCVFSEKWRPDSNSKELKQFLNNRIYTSTSLIDEKSKEKIFASSRVDTFAIIIMDCDEKDIICASHKDSYSEEKINNNNLIIDKKEYSNLLLQDNITIDGKNHKLFAEAVECETPKNLLNNIARYTEVNLRNAKPVGVICPNARSEKFAKKQAKQLNVPLYNFE